MPNDPSSTESALPQSPRRHAGLRLFAVLFALMLFAVACGSDGEDAGTTTTDAASTVAAAPTTAVLTPATDAQVAATPTTAAAAPATSTEQNAAAATEPPRFWRVANVSSTLNVRSGPGTDNEIVGSLAADARQLASPGDVTSDGTREWRLVDYGSGSFGWVAADFLAPDDNPTPPVAGTNCNSGFADFGRIAAIAELRSTTMVGAIRTEGTGSTVMIETVTGTLSGDASIADVTVTDSAGVQRTERWELNSDGLSTGTRVLTTADCNGIAGWVNELVAVLPAG